MPPAELVEKLWPNPNTQPLSAHRMISVAVHRLRRIGLEIDTIGHGRRFAGYELRRQPLARLAS